MPGPARHRPAAGGDIPDNDCRGNSEHGPAGITVHPAEENREVLKDADVAIITASTLVNGTFEEVAGYAKHARIRALYGSSAQLIPDVLFENGINIVMSVAISDPARFGPM